MVEEKLKQFILSRYRSVLEFTTAIGMPYATFSSIMRRGIWTSNISNLFEICEALGISIYPLLKEGRIVPLQSDDDKETDIEDAVALTKINAKNLTLDGVPLSQSEIDTIFNSIDIGIGLVRKQR